MGILNEFEKKGQTLDLLINRSGVGELPEIGERVKKILEDDAAGDKTGSAQGSIMRKIKGLGILRDGVYSIDLEKTIEDMFEVMKGMEAQLDKVLTINSHLEKDRNEAKKLVVDLRKTTSQLEGKIARMEEDLPSKRALRMQIEQITEERNDAQTLISDQRSRINKLRKAVVQYQNKIGNLEEERQDAVMEVNFLESKLNKAAETIKLNNNSINELQGENLALTEKTTTLDEQFNETLNDKYRLMSELKRSEKAVGDLHSAVAEKRLHVKKSYYESSGKHKDKNLGMNG